MVVTATMDETHLKRLNICTEIKARNIKSQRNAELEALRMKGLAKERRNWLNELVTSPLTTAEEARQFLAVMKDKSRRESFDPNDRNSTPTRPKTFLLADGVDSWFMQQRHRDKELRKRRKEAAQLLHGYKGYYPDKDGDLDFGHWSPRNSTTPRNGTTPKGRSSFGGGEWSESRSAKKDKKRRQTSFARLENNEAGLDDSRDDFFPSPLPTNRTDFLKDRPTFDGTGYDKPENSTAYVEGHTLFKEAEDGEQAANVSEGRDAGATYTPFRHMSVDTSFGTSDGMHEQENAETGNREGVFDERGQESSGRTDYHVPQIPERQGVMTRETLESRRQRHYDGLFQPGGGNSAAKIRGASVRKFMDGKVQPRIDENQKRIDDNQKQTDEVQRRMQDSNLKIAERLEKRFAETHMESPPIPPSTSLLSTSTDGSAPQLPETIWRDFISDEPGARFPPEAGRYHLYASYACPGSHRALIVRALKGLEDVVSVTIVHPTWRHTNREDPTDKHRGWVFGDPFGKPFRNTTGRGGPFPAAYKGNEPDPIFGASSVRELYEYARDTSGKYTIPLLWDKKTNTIVNNESSDVAYMFNSCFNKFAADIDLDLYTEDDEDGLHKLNEVSQWLYPMMIHGVYRCGFAKTQEMYDNAINQLTAAFDMAEELLSKQRYLTGDTLTDADLRLFVTLLRFDEVYAFYFRANTRLVMLSPALLNFCREIYQMKGVAETCDMDQIKAHFYGSHAEWNKYSVIPRGLGFIKLLEQPHDRDQFECEEATVSVRNGRVSF
ncbi:unnamed protein product [Cylindrotheca closterium]|uniref:GST C-terminal domain-containing protein n=1 Tax=Cylindrotheca closterium TaxID=2856 RepID=A0AAD2FUB2_9STRA|nr:unnamed protein product [Cylindrotheca closterium]